MMGLGWLPPDPPPGHGPHRYVFQVYALDSRPELDEGAGRGAVVAALKGRCWRRGGSSAPTSGRPDGLTTATARHRRAPPFVGQLLALPHGLARAEIIEHIANGGAWMRRMTRGDLPADPAKVVRALRACRETMLEVQGRVRPTGPVYHGAAMVMASIDAFATLLTGQRYYFSADGSVAAEARRAELREQGEWERGGD